MIEPSLSFKCIKRRLKFFDVNYLPYKNGGGYFRGPDQAIKDNVTFEARIPCFVADRPDDELVDAEAVNVWLQTVGLTAKQVAEFWGIQDYGEPDELPTTDSL
jgi:hypothetical protein